MRPEVFGLLGKISGSLLLVYVLLKSVDTLIWMNRTSPGAGFAASAYYMWEPFGSWVLFAEIIALGLVPALILLNEKKRADMRWLIPAALLACSGVTLNRLVMTIQTLALPTLPFDRFLTYWPSWQEFATFGGVIAYGVVVYSLSFRYLNLFPQEKELTRG